jgi:flagellar biosynthesis/type III secretory pathway protein FliH
MSEGFVPLAVFLRPLPPPEPPPLSSSQPADGPDPSADSDEILHEYSATFGVIRRFRAAVADALDVAVAQLLAEIAENVLARELALGAADVAAIVAKTRERFADEKNIVVRVHPRDRDALRELEIDTVVDQTLTPGDIIAELRSGTIDLRLGARLEMALTACAR